MQANVASKNDIANSVKKLDFHDKLKRIVKKLPQIKEALVENEFKKLQTFD